jgi:hypothetical protein
MNRDPQNLPEPLRELTTSRQDWDFKILWSDINATSEDLARQEAEAVWRIRQRRPDLLLNTLPVDRPDLAGLTAGDTTFPIREWSRITGIKRTTIAGRLQSGWSNEQAVGFLPPPERDYRNGARGFAVDRALTKVIDDNGKPMLISEAAIILGCAYRTLSARLTGYRNRDGKTQVTLAELKQGTEKYHKLKKGTPPPK